MARYHNGRSHYTIPCWTSLAIDVSLFIVGAWLMSLYAVKTFDWNVGRALVITGAIGLLPAFILGVCLLEDI